MPIVLTKNGQPLYNTTSHKGYALGNGQTKTVTLSDQQQTIMADSGKILESVIVPAERPSLPVTVTDAFISRQTAKGQITNNSIANLKRIKGRTVKMNQLVQNGNFADGTSNWRMDKVSSYSVSNNIYSFTANEQLGKIYQYVSLISTHKYYVVGDVYSTSSTITMDFNKGGTILTVGWTRANQWKTISGIIEAIGASGYIRVCEQRTSDWDAIQVKNVMCIDLTSIFGSGNEPSTVEQFETWLTSNTKYTLDSYIPYTTGTLKSFGDGTNPCVISKDANNTVVQTIPLNLTNYFNGGMKSAGTVYDEINDRVAYKRIGMVDMGSLNWYYSGNVFKSNVVQGAKNVTLITDKANLICAKYIDTDYNNLSDKTLCLIGKWSPQNVGTIWAKDSTYSSAQDFKTAMNGVYLFYELATPTTQDYTENTLYSAIPNGTEQVEGSDVVMDSEIDYVGFREA